MNGKKSANVHKHAEKVFRNFLDEKYQKNTGASHATEAQPKKKRVKTRSVQVLMCSITVIKWSKTFPVLELSRAQKYVDIQLLHILFS